MDHRTPLGKVRGHGSAKSGTGHFWQQRVTAIANVPLTVFLVWFVIAHLGAGRAALASSLGNPFIAAGLALAFLSMLWHMRLGLQTVIEDYVHAEGAKLALLLINTFAVFALGAAAFLAIVKLSLA